MNRIAKQPKSDYDRLRDQLRFIADENGRHVIAKLNSNSLGVTDGDNEYLPHTLLKLAYLNYYLGIFATIAASRKQNRGFSRVLFIDAFGGSGLVKIKNTGFTVLGSSLLALLNDKFDKVISFEIDEEKADLLSKRMELISPGRGIVITGDVNSNIEKVVNDFVNSRTIVLFFVDPEGMEPNFSQLKALTDKSRFVDIMMNYTWGVYRLQGRIEKRFTESDFARMKTFLPNYEQGKTPDEALLELFEKEFGKPYGEQVAISSKGNKIEYWMILRVRETKSKSNFLDAMKLFGNIIEKYDGEKIKTIMQNIKGMQGGLTFND